MADTRTYSAAYTGDSTIPGFVTFCIEEYKIYKGISGQQAMERLSEAGVLEYIAEQYDALQQGLKQSGRKDLFSQRSSFAK